MTTRQGERGVRPSVALKVNAAAAVFLWPASVFVIASGGTLAQDVIVLAAAAVPLPMLLGRRGSR